MKNIAMSAADYSSLRKKFPIKDPAKKQKKAAALKKIARDYERKREELGLGSPGVKRGPLYYMIVIGVMTILAGSFIAVMTGTVSLGKKRISKADIQARQSMDALAQALGRYKFHTGAYPSSDEGLKALEEITPKKRGWNGPYVRKVVPDPWGHAYEYDVRPEGGHPILYSRGPDGRAGTSDDVMPDQELFEKPFRDTTWTNHWMPYQLRGIVVAPDEETKRQIEAEVKKY